jgi:hypothetical protein
MEDAATALGNAITALTGDSMKQFAAAAEKFANTVNAIVPSIKSFAQDHPLVSNATIAGGAGLTGWLGWKGCKGLLPESSAQDRTRQRLALLGAAFSGEPFLER